MITPAWLLSKHAPNNSKKNTGHEKTQTKDSEQPKWILRYISWKLMKCPYWMTQHAPGTCHKAPRAQNAHMFTPVTLLLDHARQELASKYKAIADQWFKSAYSNIPAHFLETDARSILDDTARPRGSSYLPRGVARTRNMHDHANLTTIKGIH